MKKILINKEAWQVRVAVLDENRLTDIYYDTTGIGVKRITKIIKLAKERGYYVMIVYMNTYIEKSKFIYIAFQNGNQYDN